MNPLNWVEIAAVVVICAIVGFVTHEFDSLEYRKLEVRFSDYRTEIALQQKADAVATAQAIADTEQEAQQEARNNVRIMDSYEARLRESQGLVDSYRDAFVRLQHAQGRGKTDPGAVPQAAGQPGVDGAAANPIAATIELCARVAAEDELNAAQLGALQAELKPQL